MAKEINDKPIYSDGYLTVDVSRWRVLVAGQRVKLSPTMFRLLIALIENRGRILTHRQLLERVWGWEYIDDLDYVRIYVWHLRQKIEPDPPNPKYILNEPGVGYCFVAEAENGLGNTSVKDLKTLFRLMMPMPPWKGPPASQALGIKWDTVKALLQGKGKGI